MTSSGFNLQATNTYLGITTVFVVFLAYLVVMLEEFINLKKSKPMLLASGIIWIIVAIIANHSNNSELMILAFHKNILEYAELLLFLIVTMTYINVLEERGIFEALKHKLINYNLTLRQLFWVTGILAFVISPIADNLTTALIMSTIVLTLAPHDKKFISCACINIVVAANAGGVFSPFGDLTSLMVWQNGKLKLWEFGSLFIPAVISFLIPAFCMSITISHNLPIAPTTTKLNIKFGAKRILGLFLATILLAIIVNNYLKLPPVAGMMLGLGLLKIFSFYLHRHDKTFEIFNHIKNLEWDTLLFFYGIMMCIGGLDTIGYLHKISQWMYQDLAIHLPQIHLHTPANIIIGILSSIVDNIPLMFAVLTMDPVMSKGQWQLVTLTLGIGGSLLSIGSAAGVALMGQSKGKYSFGNHLTWSWAILLGYIAAIYVHFILNYRNFS